MKKDIQHRTYLINYVYGILPTNAHLHRRDLARHRCPACGHGTETWLHTNIRCSQAERQNWRAETLGSIIAICRAKHTDPQLQCILHRAVAGWMDHLDSSQRFNITTEDFPKANRRLICHQNLIGWENLFQGRFSIEWSRLQDDLYSRPLNHTQTKKRPVINGS